MKLICRMLNKAESDHLKQITALQQKVYDISDYKLKEAIDHSKDAQAKVDELKVKIQDIIFRNSNGEGERIDRLFERINILQSQIEDLKNYKTQIISSPKHQQLSGKKQTSNRLAPIEDFTNEESIEINNEIIEEVKIEEPPNSEEEITKKREARKIAVFPQNKDPQKVLHHKIKEGMKQHSENKLKELEHIFREESPLRATNKTFKNIEKMKSTASKALSIHENQRSISPDLPAISDK